MQVATSALEERVMDEFTARSHECGYNVERLDARDTVRRNPLIRREVLGSLLFKDDLLLDPRSLFHTLLPYLASKGVEYRSCTAVVGVAQQGQAVTLSTAHGDTVLAGRAVLTTGADVHSLYPDFYAGDAGIKMVKLQMMRLRLPGHTIGVPVTSPQSMRRYPCFRACPSHPQLALPSDRDAVYDELGIHVIIRPAAGPGGTLSSSEVVVGDSHEYASVGRAGVDLDDRIRHRTTLEILRCAGAFAHGMDAANILEQWTGIYMQHDSGVINGRFSASVDGGRSSLRADEGGPILVCTGIGGGGMTAAPALAEENVTSW